MKLKGFVVIVLLQVGIFGVHAIQQNPTSKNGDNDDDREEEILTGPGTYHFIAATHSLKNALSEQLEEISNIKKQIASLLERLENGESLVNILERNITGRLENLETEKNPHPAIKIETVNIYDQLQCRNTPPETSNGTESPYNIVEEQLNLQDKFSNLEATVRAMDKRVAELEKMISEAGVDKLDSVYESFQGSKTIIAKSPYSSRMYIFPMSEKLVFQAAKTYCQVRNTTLASMHSQGEYNFVKDWLSTHFKVYSHLWLGHQRPSSSAAGSSDNDWHDGTTIDYASWGRVDNNGSPNSFGCMFMCHYCSDAINGWYIRPCNDKQNFLCQKLL